MAPSFSLDTQSLWLAVCIHLVDPGAPFPLLCPHHYPTLSPQGTGAPWDSSPLTKQQASHVLPPRSLTHHDFSDTLNSAPIYPAPDGHVWPLPLSMAPCPPGPASAPELSVLPQQPSVTTESPLPVGPDPGALGHVWHLWPLWAPSPLNVENYNCAGMKMSIICAGFMIRYLLLLYSFFPF